jgi:hypothetical protein
MKRCEAITTAGSQCSHRSSMIDPKFTVDGTLGDRGVSDE